MFICASAPLDRASALDHVQLKLHMIECFFFNCVEHDHTNDYVHCLFIYSFIFVLADELGSLGVDFGKFLVNG